MRGATQIRTGFWLVFLRELGWLRRRRFLLALTTLAPLLLMVLLSTIFSAGLATRLPIGVLDLDGSDLSRSIIRAVDATPEAAVTTPLSDLAQGKALIRAGKIHGLLMLPQNLKRDVYAGRQPDVVFFYNTQTLTTGNTILRGVNAAVATAEAGIKIELRTSNGQPVEVAQAALQPIPVQVNALFNPSLNYIFFLLATVVPAVLQILIVTSSAYTVGMDGETPHRLRILRRLGGGLVPAMAGKILPYTLIYLLVLGLSDIVLFGVLGAPLRGQRALLALAGTLFILACQFLGALFAILLTPTAKAVSIGSLLTAPAFGFMGIGFPRLAMNGFAQAWGGIMPGAWYLMARIDQTVRGAPVDLSLRPILVLAAMVLLFAGLCAAALEIRRLRLRKPPPQPVAEAKA